jgi:leucyl/phenylalanyl-tRNA--protein transferase
MRWRGRWEAARGVKAARSYSAPMPPDADRPAAAALTADDLIACYRQGVFPMAEGRDEDGLNLIDPHLRGVFPLDRFHVPKRLARTVRQDRMEVRVDTVFARVVAECAEPEGDYRDETWINAEIERLYGELHARGLAHSVECWRGGELVGGLYGVAIGAAFFGESMFSRETDASKVALVHLVGRLIVGGYRLLDAQFHTDHLAQFGIEEIPRSVYQDRLAAALAGAGDFGAIGASATGAAALQAISQRS